MNNNEPRGIFSFIGKLDKNEKGKLRVVLPTEPLERHGWRKGDSVSMRISGIRGSPGEVVIGIRKIERVK